MPSSLVKAWPQRELAYERRLEAGPWFTVGEQLDGPAMRQSVSDYRGRNAGDFRPYAVYVHVPFCETICSFCALYTHGLGENSEDRLDEYLDAVLRSLELNPWHGSAAAPTTVHFGGGTPLVLGVRRFERLVRALRDAFGTSPGCEWAVETTTSSLEPDTVEALEQLGVRRIHLGIQTLDDATRTRVGRHETGDKAIERLLALEARGLQTSVDLILGLGGVSAAMVEDDLERLYQAGVRMFSICELRERGRATFLASQNDEERARRNYAIWQTVWRFMEQVELIPIHIGQFARGQADNLYFTHPARGEDCVAIGPYSHGSAGSLSYENLLLPEYYSAIDAGVAPIAMGVDYRAAEQVVCALERELLTHRVTQQALDNLVDAYPSQFEAILDSWFNNGLLQETNGSPEFKLTMNGSWFVGNLIAEARGLALATGFTPRHACS